MKLAVFVLALACASVTAPGAARADDAGARVAFRKGVDLYDHGRWADALEAFRTAYREKPSAIIKQNIGLCQGKLGHLVEAATAFDEALDEGATTLSPATKAAIADELRELELRVATLRLRVVDASGAPVENVTVSVDGSELAPGALKRPIRLEPGTHVIAAHGAGWADPPTKKLSLLQGSPVDATFEMAKPIEPLPAPVVTETEPTKPKDAPASYEAPVRKPPPPPKRLSLVATLGLGGESLRLGEGSGEAPGGARHGFFGGAIGVRFGTKIAKPLTAELRAELGSVTARYATEPNVPRETRTSVSHLALTPMVRVATSGPVRFTAATGVGLYSTTVTAEVARQASTDKRRGTGLAASWLVEAGGQMDAGPVAFEALVFGELHGVSNARDDVASERMLLASPAVLFGARLGLVIPF